MRRRPASTGRLQDNLLHDKLQDNFLQDNLPDKMPDFLQDPSQAMTRHPMTRHLPTRHTMTRHLPTRQHLASLYLAPLSRLAGAATAGRAACALAAVSIALAPVMGGNARAQSRPPVAASAPPQGVGNYRQLIADALAAMPAVRGKTAPAAPGQPDAASNAGTAQAAMRRPGAPPLAPPLGPFEAGPLRVSRAPQPGDYVVCVRASERGQYAYFAAFVTEGKVEAIRRGVGIDRCWLETGYAALPRPTPPKKKKDPRLPARR